jgi:hypothetical protein
LPSEPRHEPYLILAATALLLSACGSSNEPAKPAVKVTDLAAGICRQLGRCRQSTAGRYYAAADGSRLLVLNNSAQQATALYRRDAGGGWQMTPAATRTLRWNC